MCEFNVPLCNVHKCIVQTKIKENKYSQVLIDSNVV